MTMPLRLSGKIKGAFDLRRRAVVRWGDSEGFLRRPSVHPNVLSLIGQTPIVCLEKISRNLPAKIWAKLEYVNPSGSVKDRIALYMLEEAEKRGDLKPGGIIVEPTSGNTGIGLALVAAVKGYKMVAVMPEAMSRERKAIMELLGAEVEIVPSRNGGTGSFTKEDIEATVERARQILVETPNSYMPNQFENPDNVKTHVETTAREIIEQTGGNFHAFVAACGTGGTFSGVAKMLKTYFPYIRNAVVEPENSPVIAGGCPGFHKIQGIGEGFVPGTMDTSLADETVAVSDADAIRTARLLAREESVLSGISGGANVFAAACVARKMNPGEIILTVIPDNAFRYFSTELFKS
jgi:cysteine synthase A